jgi:multidrug resistance efflux pump
MKLRTLALGAAILVAVGAGLGFRWAFRSHEEKLHLPGTVEIQEVRLSSKIGGRVKKVAIAEGAIAQPGHALIYFEYPELEAQRDQVVAKLQTMQATRDKAYNGARPQEKAVARAQAESAKARWDKLKAGYRVEEKDQARADTDSILADLERAQLALEREKVTYPKASAKADLEQAQANVKRLHGQFKSAEARLTMLENGSRLEDIAEAAAEFAKAQANFELIEAGTRAEELVEADGRVAELKGRLAELEAQIREAIVFAPEQVVVDVVSVRAGDVVAPNQTVVRVLRTEDLWVKTFVSEVDLGKVKLQQSVEVTCDSFPGKRFQGTVVQIASSSEFTPRNVQSVDERHHQVFAVKVRVTDPQGVFKSGMAADVWLTVQ